MKSKFLDAVGLSAAFLCLIHCLAFPLLLMLAIAIVHNPYIDLVFSKTCKKILQVLIKTKYYY